MSTILRMLTEREENKGVELTGGGAKARGPRTRATMSAGIQGGREGNSKAPHAKTAYWGAQPPSAYGVAIH